MAELSPYQAFVEATFKLSRHAPLAVWSEFLASFSAYASHACEEAVQAPTAEALPAHGRAQALVILRKEFKTIEATYQKMVAAREKQSRPAP